LAARLRAEDLDDPAARQAAPAQGDVQAQRPAGDALDVQDRALAQLHDRAFAELLLDLRQGVLQFPVVRRVGHGCSSLAERSSGNGRFLFWDGEGDGETISPRKGAPVKGAPGESLSTSVRLLV